MVKQGKGEVFEILLKVTKELWVLIRKKEHYHLINNKKISNNNLIQTLNFKVYFF